MSPRRLVAIVAAFALALSVGACTSHKPKPVTKDIGAGVAATSTELRSDLKAVANASVREVGVETGRNATTSDVFRLGRASVGRC